MLCTMNNPEKESEGQEISYTFGDFIRDLETGSKKVGLPSKVKLITPKSPNEFTVILRPLAGIAKEIRTREQ